MKKCFLLTLMVLVGPAAMSFCGKCYDNENLKIESTKVTQNKDLGILVWEIKVKGKAGDTTPKPVGQLNGAPVLGYVFPTTLKPQDVGFSDTEGIVAMALTSHPDFDDTPMWDEDADRNYNNDGIIWHPHWVVLVEDDRVAGKLSVKQYDKNDTSVRLPANNPGMPMYMDSPGFNVVTTGNIIKVIVPEYRVSFKTDFKFDAVACYMEVNTGDPASSNHSGNVGTNKPMLGVYQVYSVASGNLSLPYQVK